MPYSINPMRPLFIGGCSRSGTTLLGAMLGAHPEGVAIPETQFLPACSDVCERLEIGRTEQQVHAWIRGHRRFRLWEFEPDSRELSAKEDPQALENVMRWLVRRWAAGLGGTDPGFWADHTPTNLRRGKTLLRLFPNATFVHIVRDGRGVAASVMRLPWGPCDPVATANWWARALADGLAFESYRPDLVLRVHFEDLVTEPEVTLRRICDHARLDFRRAMVDANGFRVPRNSREQHRLVGRSPDSTRVMAWRDSLSRRDIEIFESQSGDLLSHLGYCLEYAGPRAVSRSERLRFAARDLVRRRLLFPILRRVSR